MKSEVSDVIIDTVPSQVPAFHMAIGRALTNWQFVEKALCEIFCKVSTCQNEKVASAIFYTPDSFAAKLNTTRSAARLNLSANLFDEFTALRRRMITASEYRNSLAHFHVSLQTTVGETTRLALR